VFICVRLLLCAKKIKLTTITSATKFTFKGLNDPEIGFITSNERGERTVIHIDFFQTRTKYLSYILIFNP